MPEPTSGPTSQPPQPTPPPPPLRDSNDEADVSTFATARSLQIRAALLLFLMLFSIAISILYVMYARGLFEQTQTVILTADDSEGVTPGMNLTFSGFPIGRVAKIELSAEGQARMFISVPLKDAKWLRESTVFTLEKGFVGGAKLRAFTGIPTDPPLKDGEIRKLLVGDASAEIPRAAATVKELVENLKTMTNTESALNASLINFKSLTDKMSGKNGALEGLLGNEQNVQKLLTALDRTNVLLARVDGLAVKADTQVFGKEGLIRDTQLTVQQLNGLLGQTRDSLKKVDAILVDAKTISGNVSQNTQDLDQLRGQVEASLRKVDGMINDLNRRWPFKNDDPVKLP